MAISGEVAAERKRRGCYSTGPGCCGHFDACTVAPLRSHPLIDKQVATVMACLFRRCEWRSEDISAAPVTIQEEIFAQHLLADHQAAVVAMGHLAEDGDLL